MRLIGSSRWSKLLFLAILAIGALAVGASIRKHRVETIRSQLWRLELGMTMEEVEKSLEVQPTSGPEVDWGPGGSVVIWSFSTRPKIEAVQPYLVFDQQTDELIEIVVDESRRRARSTP